jgi:hypothetical protein
MVSGFRCQVSGTKEYQLLGELGFFRAGQATEPAGFGLSRIFDSGRLGGRPYFGSPGGFYFYFIISEFLNTET